MVTGGGSVTGVHPVTGSRLHHLSASVRPRGHSASGRGRGIHRRASGRRGSGPRPSCCPTLDPKTGRGTSDNPGTARVGPGRRQPPPNPRALNRRPLPPLMLRHVRCFSCRKHYPIQRERILLSGEFAKKFRAEVPRTCAGVGLLLFPATDSAGAVQLSGSRGLNLKAIRIRFLHEHSQALRCRGDHGHRRLWTGECGRSRCLGGQRSRRRPALAVCGIPLVSGSAL
jgi:hypothetical protein